MVSRRLLRRQRRGLRLHHGRRGTVPTRYWLSDRRSALRAAATGRAEPSPAAPGCAAGRAHPRPAGMPSGWSGGRSPPWRRSWRVRSSTWAEEHRRRATSPASCGPTDRDRIADLQQRAQAAGQAADRGTQARSAGRRRRSRRRSARWPTPCGRPHRQCRGRRSSKVDGTPASTVGTVSCVRVGSMPISDGALPTSSAMGMLEQGPVDGFAYELGARLFVLRLRQRQIDSRAMPASTWLATIFIDRAVGCNDLLEEPLPDHRRCGVRNSSSRGRSAPIAGHWRDRRRWLAPPPNRFRSGAEGCPTSISRKGVAPVVNCPCEVSPRVMLVVEPVVPRNPPVPTCCVAPVPLIVGRAPTGLAQPALAPVGSRPRPLSDSDGGHIDLRRQVIQSRIAIARPPRP